MDAVNAGVQTVVGMADAAQHIQKVTEDIAANLHADQENKDNEFNMRNQFLENALQAVKNATVNQFNVVICTNQEKDDFQNLKGQILPMNLITLTIAPNKTIDFQVYVFDTGNYLRHGKYETDYWQFFGESKKWYDPAAMHVDFNNAQPKLDPSKIQAAKAAQAATTATTTAANAATTAVTATANATNASTVATQAIVPTWGTPAANAGSGCKPLPFSVEFCPRKWLIICQLHLVHHRLRQAYHLHQMLVVLIHRSWVVSIPFGLVLSYRYAEMCR